MSSNPFRRSRGSVAADPASASIFDNIRDASDAAAPNAATTSHKTKTKRVVIQTPPHSPEEVHHSQNGDTRLGASSPPPAVDPRTVDLDYADGEGATVATGYLDARRAGSSAHDSTSADAAPGATRAPYNPFARKLATEETGPLQDSKEAEINGIESRPKPALDVDAFKNILLTGAPLPAGLSATSGATRIPDSNGSSIDTSVFDHGHGPHPESPKDDFRDYESASDEDDDEHSELMGAGRSDDLAPPAPPKSKKGPQTVSFADFDQSIPPGFMASGPRTPPVHSPKLAGILRSASPRPGSDLNKPLPAPPGEHNTAPASPAPARNFSPSQGHGPVATAPPPAKAVPPPPPSRKSGSGHGRARSSSNLSNVTLDSSIPAPADSVVVPTNSAKLAPPPPPARKSHSSNQSAPIPPPKDAQPTSNEAKLAPPPPPLRRHPSKASKGSSNISRQTSDDSTTASRSVQYSAPGAAAPPPPPPRRPPGSKRTSLDGPPSAYPRTLSGEHHRGTSFDSERSASISSLQKVAEMGESNEQAMSSPGPDQSKDILAEMSAFQAEIDALAQASKGK
ncbi:hypothetical protein CERZMDRAFT_88588 [Cercospora zeae-maydis SCOH1-5]|uniref:Uncharacterized protein n=1 Tax=Cercospora zeae-maydis SCOH1-5 TaxID=717836 RepID=A0A6A6F260_9PEZI|nr:hypothetical protein CERZMDRAFT_88588 [Cercospora zeae-maydis SCOH1-5]